MKICTECGAQLSDDTRFCTSCGASLADAQVVPGEPEAKAEPVEEKKEEIKEEASEVKSEDITSEAEAVSEDAAKADAVVTETVSEVKESVAEEIPAANTAAAATAAAVMVNPESASSGYSYEAPKENTYSGNDAGVYTPPSGSKSGIQERNIGICILLWFVTCGIYTLYWVYKLNEEINRLSDHFMRFLCMVLDVQDGRESRQDEGGSERKYQYHLSSPFDIRSRYRKYCSYAG